MTTVSNGFVKIHRKLLDNPISDKPNYLAVWLFLILEANHKDACIIFDNQKMTIKRGQCLTSIRKISKKFKLSLGSVHNILKYLISERMIERSGNNRCSLVTIINYDLYQEVERKTEQSVNSSRTVRETNKKNKNEKNEKKRESKLDYLLNLLDEDYEYFTKEFYINSVQVKLEGKKCHNWVVSKGKEKEYKNFKATLRNWIARTYEAKL